MRYALPSEGNTPTWPSFLSLTPPRWRSSAARDDAGTAGAGALDLSRAWRATALLWNLGVQVVESLLLVRLVMIFLAANPAANFAQVIYGGTAPLVAPFQDVFATAPDLLGRPLDATALLAMLVYALAARLVVRLVRGLARL